MPIYVARRPFKSNGVMYDIGSIIKDPTAIRFFKTKVRDKKIVEVTKANKVQVIAYIKARAGIDITAFLISDEEKAAAEKAAAEKAAAEKAAAEKAAAVSTKVVKVKV